MDTQGIHLTVLIGPTVPVPASPSLVQAIGAVQVTHTERQRSGFQITFNVGRSGPLDVLDYPTLLDPLLRPFNRVILLVALGGVPQVLMDGIITRQDLSPSEDPGQSTVVVTGEDVSVMMDLAERSAEHPGQDEYVIANKIIATYAQYGLVPVVIPPPVINPPLPTDRIPVQLGTDLGYLLRLAGRYGYTFYVTPGPLPGANTAYWGPPVRTGVPQRALSTNLGYASNVSRLSFSYDGLAATRVEGSVQDRTTGAGLPVMTPVSTRPPLSSQPAWLTQTQARTEQYRDSGVDYTQGLARAQGRMDAASDRALTAHGSLDAVKYGALLSPRGLVGVRGAGYSYDGLWYVKSVTHNIRPHDYTQDFVLERDGLGSLTPAVIP